MHSNATMLYGHIEQYRHRVDHMERLRQLQDKTHGFQTFIPLKFRNKDNQMAHVPESTVVEDLRNYAISRIYLDRSEEHTSELQSLMRISYAVFCLKKKNYNTKHYTTTCHTK